MLFSSSSIIDAMKSDWSSRDRELDAGRQAECRAGCSLTCSMSATEFSPERFLTCSETQGFAVEAGDGRKVLEGVRHGGHVRQVDGFAVARPITTIVRISRDQLELAGDPHLELAAGHLEVAGRHGRVLLRDGAA